MNEDAQESLMRKWKDWVSLPDVEFSNLKDVVLRCADMVSEDSARDRLRSRIDNVVETSRSARQDLERVGSDVMHACKKDRSAFRLVMEILTHALLDHEETDDVFVSIGVNEPQLTVEEFESLKREKGEEFMEEHAKVLRAALATHTQEAMAMDSTFVEFDPLKRNCVSSTFYESNIYPVIRAAREGSRRSSVSSARAPEEASLSRPPLHYAGREVSWSELRQSNVVPITKNGTTLSSEHLQSLVRDAVTFWRLRHVNYDKKFLKDMVANLWRVFGGDVDLCPWDKEVIRTKISTRWHSTNAELVRNGSFLPHKNSRAILASVGLLKTASGIRFIQPKVPRGYVGFGFDMRPVRNAQTSVVMENGQEAPAWAVTPPVIKKSAQHAHQCRMFDIVASVGKDYANRNCCEEMHNNGEHAQAWKNLKEVYLRTPRTHRAWEDACQKLHRLERDYRLSYLCGPDVTDDNDALFNVRRFPAIFAAFPYLKDQTYVFLETKASSTNPEARFLQNEKALDEWLRTIYLGNLLSALATTGSPDCNRKAVSLMVEKFRGHSLFEDTPVLDFSHIIGAIRLGKLLHDTDGENLACECAFHLYDFVVKESKRAKCILKNSWKHVQSVQYDAANAMNGSAEGFETFLTFCYLRLVRNPDSTYSYVLMGRAYTNPWTSGQYESAWQAMCWGMLTLRAMGWSVPVVYVPFMTCACIEEDGLGLDLLRIADRVSILAKVLLSAYTRSLVATKARPIEGRTLVRSTPTQSPASSSQRRTTTRQATVDDDESDTDEVDSIVLASLPKRTRVTHVSEPEEEEDEEEEEEEEESLPEPRRNMREVKALQEQARRAKDSERVSRYRHG